MIRFFALATLLFCTSALAQEGPSKEQLCQMKCGEAMNACMAPCMGSNPKDAAKPENRDKTMACVKKCTNDQKPCLNECKKQKGK